MDFASLRRLIDNKELSIEVIETPEGKKVVVAKIPKTGQGCHTFKGRLYARVGNTTQQLEGNAQLEFLRNKGSLMFDEVISEAKLGDINEARIREYLTIINQNNFMESHNSEDFLLNARLATLNGDFKTRNPALLLFGKLPQKFIPQAEIRTVCFKGDDKGGNILSSKIIQGTLNQQIEEAILFIRKTTGQTFVIGAESPGKRTQIYEYPLEVLREAVVNAVAHRDYLWKHSENVLF